MFGVSRKKYIKKFNLAKSSRKVIQDFDYKKNLKCAIIISIIISIFGFHFFPRITKYDNENVKIALSLIEVIDIPNVRKFEPPPALPPVKEMEPLKTETEKQESKTLKDEIKEHNLKLDINHENTGELLLVDSQLSSISEINFTGRPYASQDFGAIEFEYSKIATNMSNDNQDLSLKLPEAKINKQYKEKSLDNSLSSQNETQIKVKSKQLTDSELEKLVVLDKNQFLLRESESTIGTEEFKTWNRINATLDRLNKDRYGELPKNVQRISNGLTVSFTYNNGGTHDIFWSKGGKVVIRVTGVNSSNLMDELLKAYDALLQLIFKINNSTS